MSTKTDVLPVAIPVGVTHTISREFLLHEKAKRQKKIDHPTIDFSDTDPAHYIHFFTDFILFHEALKRTGPHIGGRAFIHSYKTCT